MSTPSNISLIGLIKNYVQLNEFNEIENILFQLNIHKNELKQVYYYIVQNTEKFPNYLKLIEILLKKGIDVNLPLVFKGNLNIEENQNVTLLMLAIMKNDIELTKIVLSYGASTDLQDSNHINAMMYCVLNNHNDDPLLLTLLINNEGNVNSIGSFEFSNNVIEQHSLFTLSCKMGLNNIAITLAESGANINFKSVPSGLTGLHYAIKNNNIQLINDLLSLKENNGLSLDMANSENTALIEYAKSVNPEACAYITDILSGKNQITEKRKNKSMKINRNNMKNMNFYL